MAKISSGWRGWFSPLALLSLRSFSLRRKGLNLRLSNGSDENRAYLERIRDPERCSEIVQAAWRSLLHRGLQSERQVLELAAARDYLQVSSRAQQRWLPQKKTKSTVPYQSNGELVAALARTTTSWLPRKEEEINRALQSNGELAAELARTTTMVAAKENEINRILQSRSWRLTAPLRKSLALARSYRARPMRHRG